MLPWSLGDSEGPILPTLPSPLRCSWYIVITDNQEFWKEISIVFSYSSITLPGWISGWKITVLRCWSLCHWWSITNFSSCIISNKLVSLLITFLCILRFSKLQVTLWRRFIYKYNSLYRGRELFLNLLNSRKSFSIYFSFPNFFLLICFRHFYSFLFV